MHGAAQRFSEETMHNRDYRHTGRSVRRSVRNAIRYGEFDQIGKAVENGVQDFTDNINEVIDSLRNGGSQSAGFYTRKTTGGNSGNGFGQPAYQNCSVGSAFRRRMPGFVSGLVYAIIGLTFGVLLLSADIVALVLGIIGTIPLLGFCTSVSLLTLFTAGSFFLMARGIGLRRRARRFGRYRDAMGGAAFCSVQKLAETVGENPVLVRKDLRKMISTSACPQGHLDGAETCFMVDDATYDEYQEAERAYNERHKAEQEEEQKKKANPKAVELEAVKAEGSEYIRQIHAANDALPEKEISDKLDKLESVTARIFDCVGQHPEKLPDIRSFMRYYMPTTLKLVKSYQEFESQPVQGENITKAKAEIENALDTVNTAFANLFDSLFADDVLDISSDISTLETLLRQGGLTGSDFAKEPESSKLS